MSVNRREFLGYSAGAMGLGSLGSTSVFSQENRLLTKPIPSTGEQMPLIGVGTNRYGSGTSEKNREPLLETLRTFTGLGGKLIDTAPSYRNSEKVLGSIIGEAGLRDDVLMATKCDQRGGARTARQIEQSMAELGYDQIDFMMVHNMRDWEDQLPVIREFQQEGKIRYSGITTSRNSSHKAVADVMRKEPLDAVQINYSLAERNAEEELLPFALEKGIAVIVNVPFDGGSLFNKVKRHALPDWTAEFDCTSWAQFFLKYIVSHPVVNAAIPGTTKVEYAVDNMGASMGRLPDASLRKRQEEFIDSI